MIRYTSIVFLSVLLTSACGSKKEAKPAAEKSASASSEAAGLSKFQKNLVGTEITDWEPTSNSGAQFIYHTLRFSADGTWTASGTVKADFEEFPCKESGSWSVSSEDGNSGTVEWVLNETDCLMREKGVELRTHIDLSGGSYKISFR